MIFKKLNKSTLIILAWLVLFTLNASAQTKSVDRVPINNKPLYDFSDSLAAKWKNNEIDLTKSFSLVLEGSLTEDGKIDTEKSTFTKSEGDEDIVNVAKSAIEAVGESKLLNYWKQLGIESFTASFTQNNDKFSGILTSNLKSQKEAKKVTRAFKALFSIAKMQEKMTDDDKNMINAFKDPFSESSQMILQFEMSKPVFQEMINRNLKKVSEKRQK